MKISTIFFFVLLALLGLGFLFYMTPSNLVDHHTMDSRVQGTIVAANFERGMNLARSTLVPTIVAQEIILRQAEIERIQSEANFNNAQAAKQLEETTKLRRENLTSFGALCVAVSLVVVGLVWLWSRRRA